MNMLTPLEEKIKRASQRYYTDGSSDLTDEEFDALLSQLRQENPDSILLKEIGTGYDVDLDSTPGERVPHKYGPAGSLSKAYSWKEIDNEFKGPLKNIDISLKLDGISAVCYYENGLFKYGLTRGGGDGSIGIDISNKLIMMSSVPMILKDKYFTGAVRGEILMDTPHWNKFLQRHPKAKNSRNATAGLINSNNPTQEDMDDLTWVVYTVVGLEDNVFGAFSALDTIYEWLNNNFPNIVPHAWMDELTEDRVAQFEEVRNDLNLVRVYMHPEDNYEMYPVDGLVMKTEAVNVVNHEIQYTAQAFKFDAESAETEVEYVEWRLSKTRYLIPRIHVKTVSISGTNVSVCTGFNAQYIRDNNIGPGTKLRVSKHGEIIPNVDEVLVPTQADMITKCPSCGSTLFMNGVHLQCPNTNCGDAVLTDTLIWIQSLIPRDGFKDALITNYLTMMKNSQALSSFSIEDVMRCQIKLAENISVQDSGWAKLWNDLHNPEYKITFEMALRALNIPRLGEITCKKLARSKDLVASLLKFKEQPIMIQNCIIHDLLAAIGDATGCSILDHLDKFCRLSLIWDRLSFPTTSESSEIIKVAITGKLSVKRSEFEKQLLQFGFQAGEIGKDTKFLITDDPTSNSDKNKKADKLGITKISETEFREKYMK